MPGIILGRATIQRPKQRLVRLDLCLSTGRVTVRRTQMDLTADANGPPEPPLRHRVGINVRCVGMAFEHEPLCAQGDHETNQI
jgi:hypothetical protein